jgi:hypothetical protein
VTSVSSVFSDSGVARGLGVAATTKSSI